MKTFDTFSYNLDSTLLGGQTFAWDKINGSYYGRTSRGIIKISLNSDKSFKYQMYPEDDAEFVRNYLNLSIPYQQIVQQISIDDYVKQAVNQLSGLRLLRQPLDDTIFSFLMSSNRNIPSIRKNFRSLCENFGISVTVDDMKFHTFPTTEALANADIAKIRACGVGFRDKYIQNAAQKIAQNHLMQNSKLRPQLMNFIGIGPKIVDCILVFSGYKTDVIPLDVWMKRIFYNLYGIDPKTSYDETRRWYQNYFGEYAAYAGQFLFEYYRNRQGV